MKRQLAVRRSRRDELGRSYRRDEIAHQLGVSREILDSAFDRSANSHLVLMQLATIHPKQCRQMMEIVNPFKSKTADALRSSLLDLRRILETTNLIRSAGSDMNTAIDTLNKVLSHPKVRSEWSSIVYHLIGSPLVDISARMEQLTRTYHSLSHNVEVGIRAARAMAKSRYASPATILITFLCGTLHDREQKLTLSVSVVDGIESGLPRLQLSTSDYEHLSDITKLALRDIEVEIAEQYDPLPTTPSALSLIQERAQKTINERVSHAILMRTFQAIIEPDLNAAGLDAQEKETFYEGVRDLTYAALVSATSLVAFAESEHTNAVRFANILGLKDDPRRADTAAIPFLVGLHDFLAAANTDVQKEIGRTVTTFLKQVKPLNRGFDSAVRKVLRPLPLHLLQVYQNSLRMGPELSAEVTHKYFAIKNNARDWFEIATSSTVPLDDRLTAWQALTEILDDELPFPTKDDPDGTVSVRQYLITEMPNDLKSFALSKDPRVSIGLFERQYGDEKTPARLFDTFDADYQKHLKKEFDTTEKRISQTTLSSAEYRQYPIVLLYLFASSPMTDGVPLKATAGRLANEVAILMRKSNK